MPLWMAFFSILLLACLALGWELLAAGGFGYRTLHSLLKIDVTIDHYGPQNHLRPGFQLTSIDERQRLFVGIVRGIHHGGEGLEQLVYHSVNASPVGKLLTPAEITHLNDVARLVSVVRPVGWAAMLLAIGGSLWLRSKAPVLPARELLFFGAGVMLIIAVALGTVGAENLFYQFHRWLFPADHQWFFYYEESLMSMMMQAPNLFGAIAAIWGLLVAALLAAWYASVGKFLLSGN